MGNGQYALDDVEDATVVRRTFGQINGFDHGAEAVMMFFCYHIAFRVRFDADMLALAGFAFDQETTLTVVDQAADHTGRYEQAGMPFSEVMQRPDGRVIPAGEIGAEITPKTRTLTNESSNACHV